METKKIMDYHSQKNKPEGARTFGERSMSWFPTKPNEVPHTEFLDDSAVGGIRGNKSLVPSPKSPGDFRFAMQLASTGFPWAPCTHWKIKKLWEETRTPIWLWILSKETRWNP